MVGYVLDLTPPVGAQCLANAILRIIRGQTHACDSLPQSERGSTRTPPPRPAVLVLLLVLHTRSNPGSISCKNDPLVSTVTFMEQPSLSHASRARCPLSQVPQSARSAPPTPTQLTRCMIAACAKEGSSACGVLWDKKEGLQFPCTRLTCLRI
jgi:hypothetical protein